MMVKVKNMIWFLILIVIFAVNEASNTCKKTDRFCNCDKNCVLYGDCCKGHPYFQKTGFLKTVLTCKEFSLFFKIWIIDKCIDENHKLAGFCLKNQTLPHNRLKSIIPVITEDDQVYENEFCAKCNNKKKFLYLNVTFKCFPQPKKFQELNEMINNKRLCRFRPQNNIKLRFCDDKAVRKCHPDYKLTKNYNETVFKYCENGFYNSVEDVTDGQVIFRNKYCCDCWNKICFPKDKNENTPFGFTYLLNFNEWTQDDELVVDITNSSNTDNKTSITLENKIINYTSIFTTILSIVALVVLIAIYSYNVIFHNFGGYLTICLSSSLLLMNLLTLLLTVKTISTSNFCKFYAIIQHYVALSNFIWMSIYALDLLQTFGFGTQNKKKSMKTLFIYCVLVFGFSATIVGSATISEYNLDFNSTIRPKYGGKNCWFTSKLGGIIWYFAPVCFLLTWNFVACVIVFYKLSKTANECQVVQKQESNSTLWLCVRLTAVFGIGYFFQIIAVLTGIKMLIVFGSMINSLQGLFLAACFIWTKRVRTVVSSTFSSTQSKFTNSNTATQKQSTKITQISKDENIRKIIQSQSKSD